MSDMQVELANTWTPSPEQDEAAFGKMAVATGPDAVWTAHVLVGKDFGFWTPGITLHHITGVFTDREQAGIAARAAGEAIYRHTGQKCTGGWTYHSLQPGEHLAAGRTWLTHWAVFEDISARFPKERS